MTRFLRTTAIVSLCALTGTPAALADGAEAFIGGALGGALGSVIGNAVSRPAPRPAPPPEREVIYVDRPRPVPYRTPVPVVVHDMTRADLADLQVLLNRYGATHGFGAGVPDGIYGPSTRRAVSAFQSIRGLPVTGIPSYALLAEVRRAVGEPDSATVPVTAGGAPPPAPTQPAPPALPETQKIEVNVMTAAPPVQPVVVPQPVIAPQSPPAGQAAPAPPLAQTQASGATMPLPSGTAPASRFEVAGVRLGATRDATRQALRGFTTSARVEEVVEAAYSAAGGIGTPYVSRLTGILADSASRTDRIEVWFGPDPAEDSAEFVIRSMSFGDPGRPPLATVEQSLFGKYGAPHVAGSPAPDRNVAAWVFGPDGSRATDSATLCIENVGDGVLERPGPQARGACGLVVVADIGTVDGLVESLTLRVRDLGSYFARQDRYGEPQNPPAPAGHVPAAPVTQQIKF